MMFKVYICSAWLLDIRISTCSLWSLMINVKEKSDLAMLDYCSLQ